MRRVLWLGVGLAIGALAFRAVSKKMRTLSPASLAGSARESTFGALASIRAFADDVRAGMAEREAEIRAAFEAGVVIDGDLTGDIDVESGGDIAAQPRGDVAARPRVEKGGDGR
jgi:hypothetical protein